MGELKEEWRDVKGYEGLYQVSNLGRVRTIRSSRPSMLNPSTDKLGYKRVSLYKNGAFTSISVHRLVAFAFCEGYKDGMVVNHKDENPSNNRADNLEWCTQGYNHRYNDADKKGRMRAWCLEKYNTDRARVGDFIKSLREEHGMSRRELGQKVGFCDTSIQDIELGKSSPSVDKMRSILEVFGYDLTVTKKIITT